MFWKMLCLILIEKCCGEGVLMLNVFAVFLFSFSAVVDDTNESFSGAFCCTISLKKKGIFCLIYGGPILLHPNGLNDFILVFMLYNG